MVEADIRKPLDWVVAAMGTARPFDMDAVARHIGREDSAVGCRKVHKVDGTVDVLGQHGHLGRTRPAREQRPALGRIAE